MRSFRLFARRGSVCPRVPRIGLRSPPRVRNGFGSFFCLASFRMLDPFFNLTIPLTIKIYELKNDSSRSDSFIFWAIVADSGCGRRFWCGIG